MRESDVYPLRLFADNVHFLHAGYVQKLLAHGFGITYQLPLGFTFRFQGKKGKGDIGEFVIDHRADRPGREIQGFVSQLFPRLIERLLHLCGGRFVLQR